MKVTYVTAFWTRDKCDLLLSYIKDMLAPLCCMVPILLLSTNVQVPDFNLQKKDSTLQTYIRASQGDFFIALALIDF